MKRKKKPYYPNNWLAYKNAPTDFFQGIEYDEFMDWKIAQWELPSSICCIIRVTNPDTLRVSEYTYQRRSAAEKKIRKLMDQELEFTVCESSSIHHLSPEGDY